MDSDEAVVTLTGDLIAEMARVRDQVMPAYIRMGAPAALAFMQQDLDMAARALAELDALACLFLLHKLKGYSL